MEGTQSSKSARWDMAVSVASFDFFSWLVMAKANGVTEVVFDARQFRKSKVWDEETLRKRFLSIIVPGPALAGLPSRFGPDGEKVHGLTVGELVAFHKAGRTFPRLRSVLPPRSVEYTVTLRRNAYNPHRNSKAMAWHQFARDIGAVVIEDYEVEPIHLYERMALYAGARMNFGVITGPLHLCLLADYPVMFFNCNKEAEAYKIHGIPEGGNYPWAGPEQIAVWEDDELSVIRRKFEEWRQCAISRLHQK